MSFKLRTGVISTLAKRAEPKEKYDLIVVGGGPAGITAAIYATRYGLDVMVIAKKLGGYVSEAPLVDDYPGLPDISGNDLVDRFIRHLEKYNVPLIIDEVINIYKKDSSSPLWCVETKGLRRVICAYAVILAIGSEKRKLGVPGEEKLTGKGVSYCAVCDGPLFKGKVVAVIGGGNSAFTSALFLSNYASKVYLIHRRDTFRALQVYIETASKNPRIEILTNTVVTEIIGADRVESIRVRDVKTGEERVLPVDGVFIEIGLQPNTEFFRRIGIEVDEEGRARVNIDKSTNIPGIYVAGDAAGGPLKYKLEQIITAAAEGAIAADAASKYVMLVKAGKQSA